jgi:hypothetical protein
VVHRGRGRRAVVVQANLFSRIVRVVSSYANQLGAHALPQSVAKAMGPGN